MISQIKTTIIYNLQQKKTSHDDSSESHDKAMTRYDEISTRAEETMTIANITTATMNQYKTERKQQGLIEMKMLIQSMRLTNMTEQK